MTVNALIANEADSVVTLTKALKKGEAAVYEVCGRIAEVPALEDIPEYHKIAAADIKKGDGVIKYGEIIGYAKGSIRAGEHVHTHNLSSDGR